MRVSINGCSGLVGALLLSLAAVAQAALPEAQIVQSRGVDQRVEYADLAKMKPWDDRNYALTKEDLAYLAPDEESLQVPIPAFFRVELRKQFPHLRREGTAQYPRAAVPMFYNRYGGILRDGRFVETRHEADRGTVPVNAEIDLSTLANGNEATIEINPSNPLQAIAGANVSGGQEMFFSTDGGETWNTAGVLTDTCCDPTVDWSSDGTVAYAAALSGSIGVSFWRSFDGGQTWVDRNDITPFGSDKEWVHVDKAPGSPYQDNVYLTYHNGNVMQIARSTNSGATFDVTAFPSAPSGIGSDITTDSAGNIYNFYGAFDSRTITLLKSTNGGDSYQAPITVASTNASFTWPIPAMESRRAWIYVAAATDLSGGTYNDSIYAAWTDTIAPEAGSAAANHTVINVAYSRDGGNTWTITNPHPTDDVLAVDRFNQWLTVDENGVVHVVFYDTRNSVNRTGTDLYYSYSTDGAQTWTEPARISTATSLNINDGQEWGDYNGISVVGETLIPVWTDNRDSFKDVFAADALNVAAEPTFLLSGTPLDPAVCAPGGFDVNLSIGQIQGFENPVTLNFGGLPAGFSGGFSANPVLPTTPSTPTVASVSVGSVPAGDYGFSILGSAADADNRSVDVTVTVYDGPPAGATLLAPGNGDVLLTTSPELGWAAQGDAVSYVVELATDPGFGNVVFSTTTSETSAVPDVGLLPDTQYFWRVRANNPCGDGVSSGTFTFTTGSVLCSTGGSVAIPDNNPTGVSSAFAVGASGTINDLDVSIVATHTWVGDLDFTLTHVNTGSSARIIDRPGVPASFFGCSADDIDVLMDDEATTPVETTCGFNPALGGSLSPNQPLSVFDGEDLGGTWELTVRDSFGSDTGTLDEWCLLASTTPLPSDVDGDGVDDSIDNCTTEANAGQIDSDGDAIGNLCDPDIAEPNDCAVGFADLAVTKAAFFSTEGSATWNADSDFNGDQTVNFSDLAIMKTYFFGQPGPSAAGCN